VPTEALAELVAMHNADIRRLQRTINTLIVTGNVMSERLSHHIDLHGDTIEPIDTIAITGWRNIV
jgi:hypothetical protein